MPDETLRSALRRHTSQIHQQLDDAVGAMDSLADYRQFVAQSLRFRGAVEPALAGAHGWTALRLAPVIAQDMDDLGMAHEAVPSLTLDAEPSSELGRLYVLEGSSVGARLLFRRAKQLGFSADFGARHLAAQADDVMRWRQFLTLLDGAADIDQTRVLDAAQDLFAFALSIYAEPADERV